jgi:gliding motility-associated-like protein
MEKKLLILFIFLSISCFAQLSNKHWIPPLHSRVADQISDQYVYLSTAETTSFNVTVTDGSGNPYSGSPFALSATNPIRINIGIGQPTKMFLNLDDVNTIVSDKGIILEGNKDFYVSFRMRSLNHSETLISKGRPGIGTSFRLGCMINESLDSRKSFVASVMATEDNTNVKLSEYNTGVIFTSGAGDITSDSQTFSNLKAGESIVFSGYSDIAANLDGIIGALITSNNPVAVNTGNVFGGIENGRADITLDQIVSASQIGKEYIFIEGNGLPSMETPLIVANEDGTAIYINDNSTPITTIDAGKYYIVPNSYYQGTVNRNLFVKTNKPVFAYQLLGGGADTAASGLNFIPPLSCFFQNSVSIPKVNQIGSTIYTADLMILTYSGSNITVNGSIISMSRSQAVLGNTDWVTYRISNITGDATVASTGPLAVGVFGFKGSASGFAGYYSGFGSNPQDSKVTVCSNTTQDLFDIINGNPDTGGIWAVPPGGKPLDGNIFDSSVNSPGEYNYTFTKDCNATLTTVSVKVNVTIQQSKNAGSNNSITICADSNPFDLFSLLGTADIGGTWSPGLASATGVFNPEVDLSGIYAYSFPAIGSCNAISATIDITNNARPSISTITDFNECDNTIDDNDTNGFVDFDLTTKNNEIIGSQPGINITYHTLQDDAESGINPINTIYSNNRIIYVRLTNAASSCHIVTSFNLVVQPLPVVNDAIIIQCDDDTDGQSDFNLTEKNSSISTNYMTENFRYFTTADRARTNDSDLQIETPTAYKSGSGTVWVTVEDQNGCYKVSQLSLEVSSTQIPEDYKREFVACDDNLDSLNDDTDRVSTFDFSSVTSEITSLFLGSSNDYSISYYRNKEDALAESDEIINTSNYRNIGYPHTQQIWVRVESTLNNSCYGLGAHITLTVNPKPSINTNEDHKDDNLICSNLPDYYVQLNAGINDGSSTSDYSYIWTKDNLILDNKIQPILDVNTIGIYTVEVKSINGCSRIRNIKVTASDIANISSISIIDLSETNTITVNTSGPGEYEYSLDAPNGPFQKSNFFDEVSAGIHEVYIRDINGCGTISKTIAVIDVPKYFTPNNDGHNDHWNVKGVTANINSNSIIFIYDRFGKLITKINTNSDGWDGTLNGKPLAADDYWYTVQLEDGREVKGHFSLKR